MLATRTMKKAYFEDQIFQSIDYATVPLAKGEYENCTFTDCIFANSNVSEIVFVDCTFEQCDWTMAKLHDTSFRSIKFVNCKLLGLDFSDCKPFLLAFNFENCALKFASFQQLSLKNTHFVGCNMEGVDFTTSDLTLSIFQDCDLQNAIFDRTILERANLQTARNFNIDPDKNRITKAKFSKENIDGLLRKYNIIL